VVVGEDAEPPEAIGGDDEVRRIEWSSMVVEVVQIGARWHVGGRLELAMTAGDRACDSNDSVHEKL
jgi:hypothetical protein